jgi:hypothetical protein
MVRVSANSMRMHAVYKMYALSVCAYVCMYPTAQVYPVHKFPHASTCLPMCPPLHTHTYQKRNKAGVAEGGGNMEGALTALICPHIIRLRARMGRVF